MWAEQVRRMAKKRRRYTDKERASLVVMLQSEGYPHKKGALQKVADYANVPAPTLHRWFHEKSNPAHSEDVNEKEFDLRAALQTELEGIFHALPGQRETAEYKDLVRGLGIVIDKILLLDGKATQRIAVTYEDKAIELIKSGKLDYPRALEVFDGKDDLVRQLFARANVPVTVGSD